MHFWGDYYEGDSYHTELPPNARGENFEEIAKKICSLRPLLSEFVVIDLKNTDGTEGTPSFFQTSRSRKYVSDPEKRYLYYVEIGIRSKNGRGAMQLYGKYDLSCKEAVRLFYEICGRRKTPDLTQWTKIPRSPRAKGRDNVRLKKILGLCLNEEIEEPFRNEILSETFEELSDFSDTLYSELYYSLLRDEPSKRYLQILAEHTDDPVLAAARAELLYREADNVSDLKAAHDLYAHAARIGSLRAWFGAARTLLDARLGPPDMERYEESVRELFDFIAQNHAEYTLFALPEVILELSRIEERHDHLEKAIEFCLNWKQMELSVSNHWCYPSKDTEKIILQLYRLTEFDPSDMDITDLFYVFKTPCRVTIRLEDGAKIEIESIRYEDEVIVKCNETYFRTVADFFQNFFYRGKRITAFLDQIAGLSMEAPYE